MSQHTMQHCLTAHLREWKDYVDGCNRGRQYGGLKGSFQNSDYKVSKEKLGAYVGDGP